MNNLPRRPFSHAQELADFLRPGFSGPETAIVLGTGLDGLVEGTEIQEVDSFERAFHLKATNPDHVGQLIHGKINGVPVLLLNGRVHPYEGYSQSDVAFPVRVLKQLGIKRLIITNAAGGITIRAGQIVCVTDHINLTGDSPLVGHHDKEEGDLFPDMSAPYETEHLSLIYHLLARTQNNHFRPATYAFVKGPQLETRSEYAMIRILGGNIVGMSSVPEVIEAARQKMKVLMFSAVTDNCEPETLKPTSIAEIVHTAKEIAPRMEALIREVLTQLPTP